MGYGQVNVGGSSSKVNLVSLFNNDSKSKHKSIANSLELQTTPTTTVYYALFSYSFGAYKNILKLQGSNDGNSWTDIKVMPQTGTNSFNDTITGYSHYKIYSVCEGDDYGPRTVSSGLISTSKLNLVKGNS